jgi:hypothetical protein
VFFWRTEGNWRVVDHLPDFPTVSERKCVTENGVWGSEMETIPLIPVWVSSRWRSAQIAPQVAEVRRWWTTDIMWPHTHASKMVAFCCNHLGRLNRLLHNELTSRSWAFLKKPTVAQPPKKFPEICGTRRFITVFTRALHWSLCWARWILSTPPTYFSKIYFTILPSTSRSS